MPTINLKIQFKVANHEEVVRRHGGNKAGLGKLILNVPMARKIAREFIDKKIEAELEARLIKGLREHLKRALQEQGIECSALTVKPSKPEK